MCSRVLVQLDTHWIVDVLMEDAVLVQRRDRLHGALGLPPADLPDLRRSVNINLTETHGFFTSVINHWISRKGVAATLDALVHVLEKESFQAVADLLKVKAMTYEEKPNQIHESIQNERSVFFDLPESILHFTGRVNELENLHHTITSRSGKDITVITTLSGLGGIGKTTLSIHYAWRYSLKFYSSVLWIKSGSNASIDDSFTRLAEQLKMDTVDRNGKKLDGRILAKSIFQYFSRGITLLILDNVENYESIVNYLPVKVPGQNTMFVLMTSRRRVWNDKVSVIELDVFTEEESLEFFKKYLSLKDDDEIKLVKKISQYLQNLPLAIIQAGAFIRYQCKNTNHSKKAYLQDYISVFQSNSKILLEFEYWIETADKYERTTLMTWEITMKKIKKENPLCVKIMKCSSYLNPDNIPTKLFNHYYSTGNKFERFVNYIKYKGPSCESMVLSAVKLLSDYSMITTSNVKDTFSVHRLVQRVIRLKSEIRNSHSKLEQVVQLLEIPLSEDKFDKFETMCLAHAENVFVHVMANNIGFKKGKELQRLVISKQGNVINYQISLVESSFKLNQWGEGRVMNKEFILQWVIKSKDSLETYIYYYAKMMGSLFIQYFDNGNYYSLSLLLEEFYVFSKEYYIQFPFIFLNFDLVKAISLIVRIKHTVESKRRLIIEVLNILLLRNKNEKNSSMESSSTSTVPIYDYVDSICQRIVYNTTISQFLRNIFHSNFYVQSENMRALAYEVEVLFPLITIIMSESRQSSENLLVEALFMLDHMYDWYKSRVQKGIVELKHECSEINQLDRNISVKHLLNSTVTMRIECCIKLESDEILFNGILDFKEFVRSLGILVYGVAEFINLKLMLKELFTSSHYLIKSSVKKQIVNHIMSVCKILYDDPNSNNYAKSLLREILLNGEL